MECSVERRERDRLRGLSTVEHCGVHIVISFLPPRLLPFAEVSRSVGVGIDTCSGWPFTSKERPLCLLSQTFILVVMIAAPINSGFILSDDPATPKTDATVSFRDIIPKPDHPRIAGIHTHNAVSWCQSRREVPAPAWLINRLDIQNIERPYKGFSADGNPDPSVVRYEADEGAPVEDAVRAVEAFLDAVPESLRSEAIKGDVEKDDEFRAWSNPELYVNPGMPIIVLRIHAVGDAW